MARHREREREFSSTRALIRYFKQSGKRLAFIAPCVRNSQAGGKTQLFAEVLSIKHHSGNKFSGSVTIPGRLAVDACYVLCGKDL